MTAKEPLTTLDWDNLGFEYMDLLIVIVLIGKMANGIRQV